MPRPGRCSGLEELPADGAPGPGGSFGVSPGSTAGTPPARVPQPKPRHPESHPTVTGARLCITRPSWRHRLRTEQGVTAGGSPG